MLGQLTLCWISVLLFAPSCCALPFPMEVSRCGHHGWTSALQVSLMGPRAMSFKAGTDGQRRLRLLIVSQILSLVPKLEGKWASLCGGQTHWLCPMGILGQSNWADSLLWQFETCSNDWCFQNHFWEITVWDLLSWRFLDSVPEMTVLNDSSPTALVGTENKEHHTEGEE